MFVVLTYDVNQKRVAKVMKICRKYLVHIQKSVFEGNLTKRNINEMKRELMKIVDTNVDSICIYEWDSMKYTKKEQLGVVEDFSNIV